MVFRRDCLQGIDKTIMLTNNVKVTTQKNIL